jgi:hypothetical protein
MSINRLIAPEAQAIAPSDATFSITDKLNCLRRVIAIARLHSRSPIENLLRSEAAAFSA